MTNLPGVVLLARHPHQLQASQNLANSLNLAIATSEAVEPKPKFWLEFEDQGLQLRPTNAKLGAPLRVDFMAGANDHRRKFGGGKGQDIAKAVGLNKSTSVSVLDATAGLGRDSFVLASLGCQVTMLERHPVVFALLADGLQRAQELSADEDLLSIVNRMSVQFNNATKLTSEADPTAPPQVVYLDPMFPHSKKSAKVKKDMQFFHELVAMDDDADELLPWAMALASHRVVVKRPRVSPFLADKPPSLQFVGKSNRFDVYVKQGFGN